MTTGLPQAIIDLMEKKTPEQEHEDAYQRLLFVLLETETKVIAADSKLSAEEMTRAADFLVGWITQTDI